MNIIFLAIFTSVISSPIMAMEPVDGPTYYSHEIEDNKVRQVKVKLDQLSYLVNLKHDALGHELLVAQQRYEDAVCDNNLALVQYYDRKIERIETKCLVLTRNAVNEKVVALSKGKIILQNPQGIRVNPIIKLIALSGVYFDIQGELQSIIPEDDLLGFLQFFVDKKIGTRKSDKYEQTPSDCLLSAALNLRSQMVQLLVQSQSVFTSDMQCGKHSVHERVMRSIQNLKDNSTEVKTSYQQNRDKKIDEVCIEELQRINYIMHESYKTNKRRQFKADFYNITK